ncbi:RluA family pseudouridine synthase [Lacihabitans lacunae]|uniref:RluA family pseudouridine synthase n=1 Tax=Lacihabitans lacunae TaxID=1028214 RepID=A0ABV7Z0W2_9BACT
MENISPEIIFEDDEILVCVKPSGVLSQKENSNEDSLLELFPDSPPLHIITRLDRRVSGLVLLAKNPESAANLSEQLKRKQIIKKYKAIVGQKPEKESQTLMHWLSKTNSKAKTSKTESESAKKAVLSYKVLQSSERYHLLEIALETGRFHQIRCQLAAIGSPILGDLKYGFKRSSPDGSIFLQAYALAFFHPKNKELLTFEINPPKVWEKYGF